MSSTHEADVVESLCAHRGDESAPSPWLEVKQEYGVIRVAEVDGQVVSALVLAASIDGLPAIEEATQPIIDSIRWRVLQTVT